MDNTAPRQRTESVVWEREGGANDSSPWLGRTESGSAVTTAVYFGCVVAVEDETLRCAKAAMADPESLLPRDWKFSAIQSPFSWCLSALGDHRLRDDSPRCCQCSSALSRGLKKMTLVRETLLPVAWYVVSQKSQLRLAFDTPASRRDEGFQCIAAEEKKEIISPAPKRKQCMDTRIVHKSHPPQTLAPISRLRPTHVPSNQLQLCQRQILP